VQSRTVLNRIIVSTADLGPSLAFYRDVVGLAGPAEAQGFATLRVADGVDLLLHERPATPSDTSVAASFVVPDVDATVRAWKEQGGAVVDEPSDRPWGERQAVVRDPDGHLVCLATAAD
jgi:catechol 2,3-dioxygenase-like lactoylglutathione lyase family enzyme